VAFENHFSDIRNIPVLPAERSIVPESEDDAFWSEIAPPLDTGADRTLWGWSLGAFSMLLLLIAQIVVYQTPSWAQNQDIRPWLKEICDKIDCRLPKYNYPEDIEVIERALEPAGDDALIFRLAIVNNGSFPVALPDLYLKLIRFNGEPLAQRIFAPNEYIGNVDSIRELPVGKPIEFSLNIANPDNKIAGYTFKFI